MSPQQVLYFCLVNRTAMVVLGLVAVIVVIALSHPSKRPW